MLTYTTESCKMMFPVSYLVYGGNYCVYNDQSGWRIVFSIYTYSMFCRLEVGQMLLESSKKSLLRATMENTNFTRKELESLYFWFHVGGMDRREEEEGRRVGGGRYEGGGRKRAERRERREEREEEDMI